MAELQAADEAARAAEARKAAEAAKKAAETTATPPATPKTTLSPEAQHLIELMPRMPEIIVDMWNASMPRQGWVFVDSTIKSEYKTSLSELAKEVYSAYKDSKGSDEGLKQLLQQHVPRQTATQTPPATPSGTPPATPPATGIMLTGPNSSTNQGQPQIIAAGGVVGGVASVVQGPANPHSDPVLEVFERNWKLSDEEVDNFKPKLGIPVFGGSTSTKSTLQLLTLPILWLCRFPFRIMCG